MGKLASQRSFYSVPKEQLDILSQLAAGPRPKGPVPGYVKFVIPNGGLEEAAAQAKILRQAGISADFEGTSLRCGSRSSYHEALRTLFDKRVKGWLGLIPTFKKESIVAEDELCKALSKLAGEPIKGARDR
jgi:hypothetical protein